MQMMDGSIPTMRIEIAINAGNREPKLEASDDQLGSPVPLGISVVPLGVGVVPLGGWGVPLK
jgi:hypothetical protein